VPWCPARVQRWETLLVRRAAGISAVVVRTAQARMWLAMLQPRKGGGLGRNADGLDVEGCTTMK